VSEAAVVAAVVLVGLGSRTGGEALAVLAVTFRLGCLLELGGVLEDLR